MLIPLVCERKENKMEIQFVTVFWQLTQTKNLIKSQKFNQNLREYLKAIYNMLEYFDQNYTHMVYVKSEKTHYEEKMSRTHTHTDM